MPFPPGKLEHLPFQQNYAGFPSIPKHDIYLWICGSFKTPHINATQFMAHAHRFSQCKMKKIDITMKRRDFQCKC